MNFHLEDQAVEIIVPFKDDNGNAISPTDLTARLLDGSDALMLDFGSISVSPGEVEAKIIIPEAYNALQGEELREARQLVVVITHAGGTVRLTHYYGIEAEQSLRLMENTFLTFANAQMLASQMINLTTFQGNTEARQRAALVEAFRRITALSMIYSIVDVDGVETSSHKIAPLTWPYIDADVFNTQFPTHFKRALQAAQLSEADEILQGNVIAQKHAQGIASETIGESSVTLRAGFIGSGSSGLSSSPLTLLNGYIDRSVHITRV